MTTFRPRQLHVDRGLALIAIESVETYRHGSNSGYRFSATVEPIALVICGPDTVRALDMQGDPVDVDGLRRDVPDLDCEIGNCKQSLRPAR